MTQWDASTISAVAALVVAVLAMFIAMAQGVQQYFITGQLIRLCDTVVFGPMPGKGRRVWQLSQFRFRVLYSIPQISLEADLWPQNGGPMMKSYAVGRHRLPCLADATESDSESNDGYSSEPSSHEIYTYNDSEIYQIEKRSLFAPLRKFLGKILNRRAKAETTSSEESGPPSIVSRTEKKPFQFPFRLPIALRRRRPENNSSSASLSSSDIGVTTATPVRQTTLVRRARRRLLQSHPTVMSPREETAAPSPSSPKVGEASWVSFCRAIEFPCGSSVRIDLVEYDADRCPSDLVSAPMQTSMRDVVIMGLMAGMEITSASFHEKSVSMQGAVGTLTSSNHPVLGSILHFTPRNIKASVPQAFGIRRLGIRGSVDPLWMARTWGVCSVAGKYYNATKRRTTRRLDDRWIRDHKGVKGYELGAAGQNERRVSRRPFEMGNTEASGGNGSQDKEKSPIKGIVARLPDPNAIQEPRSQDGFWTMDISSEMPLFIEILGSNKTNKGTNGTNTDGTAHIPPPTPSLELPVRTTSKGNDSQKSPAGKTPKMQPIIVDVPDDGSQQSWTTKAPERQPTVEEVPDSGEGEPQHHHQRPTTGSGTEYSREGKLPFQSSSREEHEVKLPPPIRRRTTVEDAPEEEEIEDALPPKVVVEEAFSAPLADRVHTAKALQAARNERLRNIQKDKELVEDLVKRGAMSSPYEEAENSTRKLMSQPLLLTNYAHNWEKKVHPEEDEREPTAEEEEAREREKKREEERLERDEARANRNLARNQAVSLTNVDIFWLCQMDITPGFWASPWHNPQLIPLSSAIDGAVTVILEALLGFLDEKSLFYTDSRFRTRFSFESTAEWMFRGKITYPAYAHNARGGVIARGRYTGVRIPAFKCIIPALELLRSYNWQVDSMLHSPEDMEEQNVELMRLDSWLSYVGRTEEISNGPHKLLKQCPALVQLLMEEYELDFQNIDLSAMEGGLQDIQGLAANVMDFLTGEELNEAEQLYVLVALLRTVKVAQCVRAGSDTADLVTILERDVQVHLV